MTNIATYNDLIKERKILEASLEQHKQVIAEDLEDLKDKLQPVVKILGVAKKVATLNNKTTLAGTAGVLAGGFALKKLLPAGGGWIASLLLPIIVKKISGLRHHDGAESESVNGSNGNGRTRHVEVKPNFLHRLADKLKEGN